MYVCKKLRLCTYLLQRGFKYIEEKPDKYNPKYKIWLFNNTPELRVAVEEYYSRDIFNTDITGIEVVNIEK